VLISHRSANFGYSHLLRRTIFCALLAMGAQGAYVTIMTWLPTFLFQERSLSSTSAGGYLIVTIAGAFFGYLTGAVRRTSGTDNVNSTYRRKLAWMSYAARTDSAGQANRKDPRKATAVTDDGCSVKQFTAPTDRAGITFTVTFRCS
jgi:hypothetical protein